MSPAERELVNASDGVLAGIDEIRALHSEQQVLAAADPQRATVRAEIWRAARRLVALTGVETKFVRRVHREQTEDV